MPIQGVIQHLLSMGRLRSQFGGPGKPMMKPLKYLLALPEIHSKNVWQFQKLERLTVFLYDKSSPSSSIVQARKEIFCHASRTMETLPPTQDTLLQHIRQAVYQTGIWATSTLSQQGIPSPRDYGWTKESGS